MGKQHSKLKQEEIAELLLHTAFTEEELQTWYKNFMMDTSSGYLSRDDFVSLYAGIYPSGDVTDFVKHIFRRFDTDKDGLISFFDFILSLSVTYRGTIEQKLRWSFVMYDLDEDGYISHAEMLEVVNAIYKMVGTSMKMPHGEDTPVLRTHKIFREMDLDRDGKLSLAEFVNGAKKDSSIINLLQVHSYDHLM